ncbi:MAG: molybdopterin molybdotransferase MoeA [Coriobacteriales bacterium]|nr:molybdopterin molybdotransferase MoeA [Coriobacteriales bacterium]
MCVEEARAIVLSHVRLMPAERVTLIESHGRVLAQDAASDIDISPFDNTAMDGFAVRFEDFEMHSVSGGVTPATPLTLNIVGIIGAGAVYDGILQRGQALRIMTGAPIPQGADTIVKIEDTIVSGESAEHPEGRQVTFTIMPLRGEHIRPRGEEAHKGDVLLHTGEHVSFAGVGLLASTGNAEVLVYRRPRVAVLSTGNELVDVTEIPGPGQIRNSNNYSIAAAVLEAGGIPTIMSSVADTREALIEALRSALIEHDFVVTSGGAAEGDYDFITPVVRDLGELFFNKVNMKPGKAQTFGIIEDTPIFGLPGNPAAASIGFEILIRPALRKMQGITKLDRPLTQAILKKNVKKKDETRRLYLRAQLEMDTDGLYRVTPEPNQSSALLGTLNRSNCLLTIPEGSGSFAAGDVVSCLRIDQEEGVV